MFLMPSAWAKSSSSINHWQNLRNIHHYKEIVYPAVDGRTSLPYGKSFLTVKNCILSSLLTLQFKWAIFLSQFSSIYECPQEIGCCHLGCPAIKYLNKTQKFGLPPPKSVDDAFAIDPCTGTTLQADVVAKNQKWRMLCCIQCSGEWQECSTWVPPCQMPHNLWYFDGRLLLQSMPCGRGGGIWLMFLQHSHMPVLRCVRLFTLS